MSDLVVREQTLLGSITEMARAGAGFLADLMAQLVHGIQGVMIAPLALAFGCQAAASDAPEKAPNAVFAVRFRVYHTSTGTTLSSLPFWGSMP